MKLIELHERAGTDDTIYAWFEPSRGPEDISGVRLAYVDPLVPHYEKLIAQAESRGDQRWLDRLQKDKKDYEGRGQKYFTPQLGWWMSVADYYNNKSGFGGPNATRENLERQYPNLHIEKDRKDAVQKAEAAGLI